MGDICPGDYVIGGDGERVLVKSIHPQGEIDVYEITFSDGTSTRCSGDHLWLTYNIKERSTSSEGSVRTTNEISSTFISERGRKEYSIPIASPVNFDARDIYLDPYLLGVLLGDGGFSTGKVLLTNQNKEIIDEVSSRLPSDTEIVHKVDTTYAFRKVENGNNENLLQLLLKSYNLLGCTALSKFVPEDYLFNTKEVRLELLQGLMDTDGTLDYKTGKGASFSTSSEKLKEAVVFLAQSLGGIAYVRSKIPSYSYKGRKLEGKLSYTVTVNLPEGINPFKLSRKSMVYKPNSKYVPTRLIANVEHIGTEDCQCISVDSDDGLYLTNDFIVTHNTTLAVAAASVLGKPIVYTFAPVQEGSLGFTPGTQEEKEAKYIAPLLDALSEIKEDPRLALYRESNPDFMNEHTWIKAMSHVFMRGTNIKDSTLIIDEAQNMTRGDLKKVLTRCHDSTTVIMIGHDKQCDLPNPSKSGFVPYMEHFRNEPYAKVIELKKNFRGVMASKADNLEW